MNHVVPVREQTIIYLVNKLRQAFKDYQLASTKGEQNLAAADFKQASDQLDAIGVRGNPTST